MAQALSREALVAGKLFMQAAYVAHRGGSKDLAVVAEKAFAVTVKALDMKMSTAAILVSMHMSLESKSHDNYS